MDDTNFKLAQQMVNSSYIRLGQNSLNKRDKIMKQLLSQRQLPQEPLDELTIRYILDCLAIMDSNNFDKKVGVGERQGRIYSRLVEHTHFYLGHGIGRSGDITANQPKAAGSSLLLQLARYLTVSAMHELNYQFVKDLLLLPLATGMSLSLSFLTLAQLCPTKKYVIWSRIDQKTCLKSIVTANLIPIVNELKQVDDFLTTDVEAMQQKLCELGAENVLALVSTTSCFAPRVPDNIEQVSLLAKKYKIFHVVNNAYGVWCSKIANSIKEAMNKGQCTVVVQSTDKNFMVPVGGSIIFSNQSKYLQKISAKYPGRGNISPIVDMFITLLQLGKTTLRQFKKERKSNFEQMNKLAHAFAAKHNCKMMHSPANTISLCMHLNFKQFEAEELTQLGSILYSKRVCGHRIVTVDQKPTKVGGLGFKNYGSHSDKYTNLPYMTFACAVGARLQQIQIFFQRFEEALKQLLKKKQRQLKEKIPIIKEQKIESKQQQILQNQSKQQSTQNTPKAQQFLP